MPQSVKKEEQELLPPRAGAEIPLQPVEQTHIGAGGSLKACFDPTEQAADHAGAGFLEGLVTLWGTRVGADGA